LGIVQQAIGDAMMAARNKTAKPRKVGRATRKMLARKTKQAPRRAAKKKDLPIIAATGPFVIIESAADIGTGVAALRNACPHFRMMHDLAGDPPTRRREAGFEGLARIIVAQQVSVASANAIWARFSALVTPMAAPTLARHDDETLRGAGLSRPKLKTLRAIAAAVEGGLDIERLDHLSDAEIHAALTAVNGVGPWTADIFIMFCLGRADAFAAGDLALQEATRMALSLRKRPTADKLVAIAERWRPWRGVAARMLWSYYAVAKKMKSDGVAA
jgi:DNA-3-methyladenine glycosylase II